MANVTPGTPEWLDQVTEDVVEPDRKIIDPHHHLWIRPTLFNYMLEGLWSDTGSGHRIEKTVFIECRLGYRESGPVHVQCVGETEFVAEIAEKSEKGEPNSSVIAGIVSRADLTLGMRWKRYYLDTR